MQHYYYEVYYNLCEQIVDKLSFMIAQVILSDIIVCDRRGVLRPWGREMEGRRDGVMDGWRDEE